MEEGNKSVSTSFASLQTKTIGWTLDVSGELTGGDVGSRVRVG